MKNLALDHSPGRSRNRWSRATSGVRRIVALPMLGAVWIYRFFVSPLLGVNCRFQPGCSEYAKLALLRHGGIKGAWLAAKRISRCHPWGGFGYDPVPLRKEDET